MYSPVSLCGIQYKSMSRNKAKQNKTVKGNKHPSKSAKQSGKKMSTALVVRAKPSQGLRAGKGSTPLKNIKNQIPQFTVASIDPFCPQAFGVKVPDEANMPSATAYSRNQLSWSTTTIGGVGGTFRFDAGNFWVAAVPVTSTTWSWPTFATTNYVINQPALNANFQLLRTVAFGLKVVTRQSAFNASGFVHIALIPESLTGTSYSYPTSVSFMEYAPYYRRIPLADLIEDEVTINGKYTDQTAFRYLSPNVSDVGASGGYNINFQSSGWSAIQVWIEAPPSITNVIDIEVIHHFEGLTASAAFGVIEETPAAPCSPCVMAATSFVTERVEPVQVNREDEENTGKYWTAAGRLFSIDRKSVV